MGFDLTGLTTAYHLKIRGVIHAGAHYGEEYDEYSQCGIKEIIFIEPCKPAFGVLNSKLSQKAILFNCALGSNNFSAEMHIESSNEGMSNSLLKPEKHLQQYPSIQFTKKELVQVSKLDDLMFDKGKYNFLYMDIQGYELEALKGATDTLKNIDYIYSEVNRDDLYEQCAKVEAIDAYLSNYERVYTNWIGVTWGDALYIRKPE